MLNSMRHLLREYRSARLKFPGGGKRTFAFIVSTWFGVSGSGEDGVVNPSVVSGLLLTIASPFPEQWLVIEPSHMRMLKNILIFSEDMSQNSADLIPDLIPWSEWSWMIDPDLDLKWTHPNFPQSLYNCSIHLQKPPLKNVEAPIGAN